MLRFAVLVAVAKVDITKQSKTAALKEKYSPDVFILSPENSFDLLDEHKTRLIVSVDEVDFAAVSDKESTIYKDLKSCKTHLNKEIKSSRKLSYRVPIFILNSTDAKMIEEAETYLGCTERPCYSVEVDSGEEGEVITKAFTRKIEGLQSGEATDHNFMASCSSFVAEYLKAKSNAWFRPKFPEEDDDDDDDDEEDEEL